MEKERERQGSPRSPHFSVDGVERFLENTAVERMWQRENTRDVGRYVHAPSLRVLVESVKTIESVMIHGEELKRRVARHSRDSVNGPSRSPGRAYPSCAREQSWG